MGSDGYDEARFIAVLILYCERNQYPELFALKLTNCQANYCILMGLNELASFDQRNMLFSNHFNRNRCETVYTRMCIIYTYIHMIEMGSDGYDEARFIAVLLLYYERNQYPELFALLLLLLLSSH